MVKARECKTCKNLKICKYTETVQKLEGEVKTLQKKYPNFYGRISVICDYYVADTYGTMRELSDCF